MDKFSKMSTVGSWTGTLKDKVSVSILSMLLLLFSWSLESSGLRFRILALGFSRGKTTFGGRGARNLAADFFGLRGSLDLESQP